MKLPQHLQEKAAAIETKRHELGKIFADNKKDGKLALNTGQIAEVNQREDELKSLTADFHQEKGLYEIEAKNSEALGDLGRPAGEVPFNGTPGAKEARPQADRKSLGQRFVESKAYKEINGRTGPAAEIDGVDVKTVLMDNQTSGAGYAPQSVRSGVLVYSAQPQPTLIDLVPQTETQQSTYKYMEETVFTNAAAETAEGAAAGEASLKFDERGVSVVKIPVFIPVTEEQLADVNGLRDIVDSRLTLMIKQRINSQVVNGDGTGQNLLGVINKPGVLTQNAGEDSVPDTVYKAMVKVMTQGIADPSGVWMNPLDWQGVRLLKTNNGQYLYGDPSQPGPNTIFGLPVAQHVTIPQGIAPVADFATYTALAFRNQIEFAVSDSHADFFVRGQLAIRAMIRLAWVMYRAQAICLAQGLTAG